jgi:hypothetical protein
MPPRKFGIEFEACVSVTPFEDSNTRLWNDRINSFLNFLQERYATLSDPIKTWCETFENTIYIYSYFKREKFNLQTGERTLLDRYSTEMYSYDKPIIMPDNTVLCHGNFEKHHLPEERKENFGLENTRLFTINIEFVTQKLSSFEEWEMFKLAILPRPDMMLPNRSQGIHLNIGVEDLSVEQIKEILITRYVPWEREHARQIRPTPNPSWAKELEEANIEIIRNLVVKKELKAGNNIRMAFDTALQKERSVHFKPKAGGILEFRLFSPTGTYIEEGMREIYSFFPSLPEIGGRRRRSGTKKLKRSLSRGKSAKSAKK